MSKAAQPSVLAGLNTSKGGLRVINVDKNAAYPKVIADLNASGMLSASTQPKRLCEKASQGDTS